MKQNGTDWSKHWFVLRGAALMYYRDPTAEDKGILDGVLDLSSVRAVSELQVQRNYGFQTVVGFFLLKVFSMFFFWWISVLG